MIELTPRSTTVCNRLGVTIFAVSFFLCLSFFLGTASVHAQDRADLIAVDSVLVPFDSLAAYPELEDWRLGVYFGVNINSYSANNMKGLPDVPSCCPGYNNGRGIGVAIGGLLEFPLSTSVSIGTRLYLETYNGALIDEESETVDAGGFAETAIFQHRIDADIWAVAVEPVVVVDLTRDFKVFGGLRGDVIAKKRFSQKEILIAPEGISFENDLTERMLFEGQIPRQTSIHGSVVAGARYDFDFGTDGNFVISPEVSLWYGLSPVVSNESWKIHGLRFAISGQFLRFSSPEEYEYEEAFDPGAIYGPVELPVSDKMEKGEGHDSGAGAGGSPDTEPDAEK